MKDIYIYHFYIYLPIYFILHFLCYFYFIYQILIFDIYLIYNIFLVMAGFPPFLDFFSKISVIDNLYFDKNYFLCILFLISSLIISFFYIQNSIFFFYLLNKSKYFKN